MVVNGSSRNVNAAPRNRYAALASSTPSADGCLPQTVLTDSMPLRSLSENNVSELPADKSFYHSERIIRKRVCKKGAGALYLPADLCEVTLSRIRGGIRNLRLLKLFRIETSGHFS